MGAATDLQTLAVAVRDAAATILATTAGGTPDLSMVVHGPPALDCCDMLAVNVGQIGEAATNTRTTLSPGLRHKAGRVNLTTLTVTLTRCYPVPDDNGNPPSVAAQEAATAILNEDGWALWNGLFRLEDTLFTSCDLVFFDGLVPLVPQGGCAGWLMQIRVELGGYNPGEGS